MTDSCSTAIILQNATVGGVDRDPITYHSLTPLPIFETLPVYAISNDTTVPDDGCNELPDSTPDLSPYLAVVRRGTCSYVGFRVSFCVTCLYIKSKVTKLANIAAKGGRYVFVYE